MKIYPVTNIPQVQNYNQQISPIFQAKPLLQTMKKAEVELPKFVDDGIFDRITGFFTNRREKIVREIERQNGLMKKLRVTKENKEEIYHIMSWIKNSKTYLKTLKTLSVGNIPKEQSGKFIYERLFFSFPCDTEKYDYLNEISGLVRHREDYDVADLVKTAQVSFKDKDTKKDNCAFVRKWVAKKGCADVTIGLSHFGAKNSDNLYEAGIEDLFQLWENIGHINFVPFENLYNQEALNGFMYLYPRCKDIATQADLFKLAWACFNTKEKRNSQQMLDYIVNNIQNAVGLLSYITYAKSYDENSIDEQKLHVIKNLMDKGININKISNIRCLLQKYSSSTDACDVLYEITDKIPCEYFERFLDAIMDSDKKADRKKVDTIFRLRDIARKNKELLREGNDELDDNDIDELILSAPDKTLQTVDVLGEKTFVYSFRHKISEVEDYLNLFGKDWLSSPEDLLKVINPIGSEEYKLLREKIKQCKSMFKGLSGVEKRNMINIINSLTKELNNLLKNAIKDPKDALELAIIYKNVYDVNPYLVDKIKPYMNPKTEEEKQKFYSVLNSIVLDVLQLESEVSKRVLKKIDFSKNKYLPQLFNADADFKEEFEKLLQRLEKHPYADNLRVFDSLEQNIKTRQDFKRLGLSYQNWARYNPHSQIRVNIDIDLEKSKQSAVRNLEADLNDDLFGKLPEEVKNRLQELLSKYGLELKDTEKQIFDDEGFPDRTIVYKRLCKNGEPIVFEDLKTIIDIFKQEMNQNEFWTAQCSDEKIHQLKETFKDHILKLRYNEVKNAKDKSGSQNIDLVVQKSDMNNIQHALFLGNHAGCCTAVDSFNGWSAVTYMMNKLVSSIEVKDGDKFVGNTMCYIAYVDNELALVLDNIELKPNYQYNDKIRDAIFAYAQKLCKEIGNADLPIYAGPNRHKVNLDGFECKERSMQIVGSTGEDSIYLDFDADAHQITGKEIFNLQMYKIR